MKDTKPTEIQLEAVKEKYNKRLELEEIRHNHIMEELAFMAKHKIKVFDRMENRMVKK